MEPEICAKMLKKLSEKLRAKFPATTRGYSMVKIVTLSRKFLYWKQAQEKVNHYSKNKRKGEKGKAKKIKKSKSLKT